MRLDPVLILMQPRSGSSMTAEIFHRHGLWVGRLEQTETYQTWENADIRTEIKRMCLPQGEAPLSLRHLRPEYTPEDVRALFRRYVPRGTDWMHKLPIDRWAIVRPAFPSARYVFVKRPTESVVRSLIDKRAGGSEEKVRWHVMARHAYLDGLAMEYGIPVVQTQEIIDGNLHSLESAMRICGIEMDPAIVARVVDRTQWRH